MAYDAKYYREHAAEKRAYMVQYRLRTLGWERKEYDANYRRENIEHKRAQARVYYVENRAKILRQTKAWALANPERAAFLQQRKHAVRRCIVFLLTLEEWTDWWGDNFQYRGKGDDDLQMCRFDDAGPYRIGNIYMASASENRAGARPLPVPNF